MSSSSKNGKFTEIKVDAQNGEAVMKDVLSGGCPVHIHIHLPALPPVGRGVAPVYNVNLNLSIGDRDATFSTQYSEVEKKELPETVGGGPSTGDVNPPGQQNDPPP